ncbi:MAG TPA: AAA family ATPase [Bryobacteraceae bacterium]|nr:AAA family ATPase [Bryobacteraceae bacterium]
MEAVILIGIQGAGKTTFYRQRFFETHVRISLDLVKTRRREQALLDVCLRTGQRFVIDNTNVRAEVRARYIGPAKAAGFRVIGYFFETPLQEALRRNRQRSGRAVIPVPGVIGTLKRLEPPAIEEGFDELYFVSHGERDEFVVTPANASSQSSRQSNARGKPTRRPSP